MACIWSIVILIHGVLLKVKIAIFKELLTLQGVQCPKYEPSVLIEGMGNRAIFLLYTVPAEVFERVLEIHVDFSPHDCGVTIGAEREQRQECQRRVTSHLSALVDDAQQCRPVSRTSIIPSLVAFFCYRYQMRLEILHSLDQYRFVRTLE